MKGIFQTSSAGWCPGNSLPLDTRFSGPPRILSGLAAWGGLDKQQGVFCQGFFWVKFGGGRIGGRGVCSLRGPLLVLGRGCALVFGWGAEVLGCYVCSTRASSFLPFLIKFLEASLEFWFAFELVFPDLDFF